MLPRPTAAIETAQSKAVSGTPYADSIRRRPVSGTVAPVAEMRRAPRARTAYRPAFSRFSTTSVF